MAELQKGRLFIPCGGGVEELLAAELRELLPAVEQEATRGGVALLGATLLDAMRVNLWSRLATRVLVELGHGPYRDEADLYALARDLYWEAWLTPQHTFRVDVSSRKSPLQTHPRPAAPSTTPAAAAAPWPSRRRRSPAASPPAASAASRSSGSCPSSPSPPTGSV